MSECNCPERTCQPAGNEGRTCWRSGNAIPVGYFKGTQLVSEKIRGARVSGAAGELDAWTIYQNPTDFPGQTVARRWLLNRGPLPEPTPETRVASLDELRQAFERDGRVRFTPNPGDDACIVETWL